MSESEKTVAAYDMHLHTYWSYDAEATPVNHFKRAQALGVKCITITEHHVLDSLPEVLEIAQDYPDIKMIPSAELTVNTSIGAVDLLCYGFPRERSDAMKQVLGAYHDWQQAYGAAISAGLVALGLPFTDEDRMALLRTYRPGKAIEVQGNTHVKGGVIRQFCVDRGFVDSIEDYGDLMKRASQKATFPTYPDVKDVIPAVKAEGAVVAIAHPHGYFKQGDVKRMDMLRVECSLDGIECAHPGVPDEFTPVYREYCEKNGMLSTGGSDCHSDADIEHVFAAHGGPDEWLDEFMNRVEPS
jgi:predicted metal-dependent phosphoesterase TrpH